MRSCARTAWALVYEVFKMAAQHKRTQRCRPKKAFLRSRRTELVWKGKGSRSRGCELLGFVSTEEQPDTKNKQSNVNETEFSPSIFFRSTTTKFPTKMLTTSQPSQTLVWRWSSVTLRQVITKAAESNDCEAERHTNLCSKWVRLTLESKWRDSCPLVSIYF